MFFHLQENIKIARGSAMEAGLAFARKSDSRPRIHARRNGDLEFTLRLPVTLAAAGGARIADDLASAITRAACAPDGKEALLIENFAASVAGGAWARRGAWLRSRSGAAG